MSANMEIFVFSLFFSTYINIYRYVYIYISNFQCVKKMAKFSEMKKTTRDDTRDVDIFRKYLKNMNKNYSWGLGLVLMDICVPTTEGTSTFSEII